MTKYKLYGAILGDLAGQPFEFPSMKGPYTDVNLHHPDAVITDDTIMTLATAEAMMLGLDFTENYHRWGNLYNGDHYGKGFKAWLAGDGTDVVDSFGNGCLMRVSPLMYIQDPLPQLFDTLRGSHKHTVSYEAVYKLYLAYTGQYNKRLAQVKPFKKFKVRADDTIKFCLNLSAQCSTPQEGIIRAIECGGDTDTNASIVGELLNFKYGGITDADAAYVESKLDHYQLTVLQAFNKMLYK